MNENVSDVQPNISLPEPSNIEAEQYENLASNTYPSHMTQPIYYPNSSPSPCSGCLDQSPCHPCAEKYPTMPMYSMGVQGMTPYIYPMGNQPINTNLQSMYSIESQGMNASMEPMHPMGVQGMNTNMEPMHPMGVQGMNANMEPIHPMGVQGGNANVNPLSYGKTQQINPNQPALTPNGVEGLTEYSHNLHPMETQELSSNMYPMHPMEMQHYAHDNVMPLMQAPYSMQPNQPNYYQTPNMYTMPGVTPMETMNSNFMMPNIEPSKLAEQAENFKYVPSLPTDLTNVFMRISPWVQYGLDEARSTNYKHAMEEIALISYLMGRGYDARTAHQIVESWEVDEMFPTEESDVNMNTQEEQTVLNEDD
ncbi:hypothetical protein [Chengkuizengella axinellae]|uniref:Spore coat protein n=1 Tax=Chengkuizengella axinellae TaxID=3064388 RepID=A0ABT9J4Q7_9BACL|nr:hypothetical protein [Chengkuizengella sp. 2205SS18-9]MDP5276593.1 hypothetical protein [Chengkuizengella sp. 2205SS18-9]